MHFVNASLHCFHDVLAKWCERAKTETVVVYDFDGPRLPDGTPTCLPLTRELLVEKINDTTYPFGHGYVVAALLAGHTLTDYTVSSNLTYIENRP